MTSSVDICNRALSRIGGKRITSLDGTSREALECNLHYDAERKLMLAGFDWVFARGRSALALEATNDRSDQWDYKYAVPSDMMNIIWINDPDAARLAKVNNQNPNAEYELAGSHIYCDVEACYIEYTKNITDAQQFPPHFDNALKWAIADAVAFPLSTSERLAVRAASKAESALSEAQATDATLEMHEMPSEPAYMLART